MTVTYNVSIYSECREEEENWKDLASVLQAGDKVISFIVWFLCRTERCRKIACGQERTKSSQELNRNFAVGGSILDFLLSSAGLIYSVWHRYRYCRCQSSVTTILKCWCDPIKWLVTRWFIIPIRPIRGFNEKYGLVSLQWETFTIPQFDRINFWLSAAVSYKTVSLQWPSTESESQVWCWTVVKQVMDELLCKNICIKVL